MAQHIPIAQFKHKEITKIESIARGEVERSYTGLKGSLKWIELPAYFKENDDTSVLYKNIKVPSSIVHGGRASLEIHLKGNKTINAMYLVA